MSRTYRRKDLMKQTDMDITNGKTLRDGKVKDGRVFHKIHGDQQYTKAGEKIKKLVYKELSKKSRKNSKRRSIQDAMETGESISRDHLNKKVKTPRYI